MTAPPRPGADPAVRSIGLPGILVPTDRLRRLRPEKVNEIAESIAAIGLINPITVKPHPSTGFVLVAGRHRLEAVRQLGLDSIRATVRTGLDATQAELVEIDENLVRADLSDAERVLHLTARKKLYEDLYPETRHGGAPGAGRGKKKAHKDAKTASFSEDVANKTGRSKRSVTRDITRGRKIVVLPEIVGTPLDSNDELDALGQLSAEDQRALAEQVKAGKKASAKIRYKQRRREEREKALAEKTKAAAQQLGSKLYSIVYADPPWRFEPWSRETGMDRAADNHYSTMADEDICALEIPVAEDCALFMWATPAMEKIAHEVMARWGFEYRSQIVWDKERRGTGYWVRSQHEILLIGVKGNVPAPAPGTQPPSVIRAAPGKHSEKPDAFAEIIERMFPTLSKVELFARRARAGWDVWGNEAPESGDLLMVTVTP
jgi:N6-adenosine-specific RNA methylase IME4